MSFYVHDERKHICGWVAQTAPRSFVPGALMGYGSSAPDGSRGVPHGRIEHRSLVAS